MRLLRARHSSELGKVAYSFAALGLGLGDRKVESQIMGENRSRHPGRETIGEVSRGRRASDRTQERVHRFRVKLGRERRASRLPCLRLGFGDDRRSTSASGYVSLAIFITSVSGSKSLSISLTTSSTSADHQA